MCEICDRIHAEIAPLADAIEQTHKAAMHSEVEVKLVREDLYLLLRLVEPILRSMDEAVIEAGVQGDIDGGKKIAENARRTKEMIDRIEGERDRLMPPEMKADVDNLNAMYEALQEKYHGQTTVN